MINESTLLFWVVIVERNGGVFIHGFCLIAFVLVFSSFIFG